MTDTQNAKDVVNQIRKLCADNNINHMIVVFEVEGTTTSVMVSNASSKGDFFPGLFEVITGALNTISPPVEQFEGLIKSTEKIK